jgi:uncharacterized protein (TIGR00661 family)
MLKVLYAIQGTGNGHISRAREIIPLLQEKCELHILVSGTQADIGLPYPINYQFNGLSFVFGKRGGIDMLRTARKLDVNKLIKESKKIPVAEYDLIINDFEPVSALAAKRENVPCISLSHQSAVLSKNAPRPRKKDLIGKNILQKYAKCTDFVGFHFQKYNTNTNTPVIRSEIRNQPITNSGHYTVYLPAYDDKKLIHFFSKFPQVQWVIFSKHNKKTIKHENILIHPINNEEFIKSMASAAGIICGAGFETPAEALFMGKKLLVVPMKSQYEQQCNAEALNQMGVPIIRKLKSKHYSKIENWINSNELIEVDYKDETEEIITNLLNRFQE